MEQLRGLYAQTFFTFRTALVYRVSFVYNAQQYGSANIFFTFRRGGTNQQSIGAQPCEIWYGNKRQLYLNITTRHGI